jgi:hypothetical protein
VTEFDEVKLAIGWSSQKPGDSPACLSDLRISLYQTSHAWDSCPASCAWDYSKHRYVFGRIGSAILEVSSIACAAHKGNPYMDSECRIGKWSAAWMIVAGRVVFTNRMESQALEDCEIPFSHALECEARDEIQNPWVALHDVLDCARG